MSRDITFKQPCPVCKTMYTMATIKPTFHTPSFFTFTCDHCDTEMMFRVRLPKNGNMQVAIEHSFIRFGEKAKVMINAAVEVSKKSGPVPS